MSTPDSTIVDLNECMANNLEYNRVNNNRMVYINSVDGPNHHGNQGS